MGSGTILDTARLRYGLSEHFQVAQGNIHAYVFGEHGDTSFIPWTGAYISGLSTDEYYEEMKAHGKDVKPLDKEAMLEYVQKSGGKVIAKKGATFYAVSATVCQLVRPDPGCFRFPCNRILYASRRIRNRRCVLEYPYPCRTKRNPGKSSDAYEQRRSCAAAERVQMH